MPSWSKNIPSAPPGDASAVPKDIPKPRNFERNGRVETIDINAQGRGPRLGFDHTRRRSRKMRKQPQYEVEQQIPENLGPEELREVFLMLLGRMP